MKLNASTRLTSWLAVSCLSVPDNQAALSTLPLHVVVVIPGLFVVAAWAICCWKAEEEEETDGPHQKADKLSHQRILSRPRHYYEVSTLPRRRGSRQATAGAVATKATITQSQSFPTTFSNFFFCCPLPTLADPLQHSSALLYCHFHLEAKSLPQPLLVFCCNHLPAWLACSGCSDCSGWHQWMAKLNELGAASMSCTNKCGRRCVGTASLPAHYGGRNRMVVWQLVN